MRQPLKVIAVGEALVNDDVALSAGDRFRFVGRSPTAAPRVGSSDEPDHRPLHERFPPKACEYADDAAHRFILKALAHGDLLALSETTAARAGVRFVRESAEQPRRDGEQPTRTSEPTRNTEPRAPRAESSRSESSRASKGGE